MKTISHHESPEPAQPFPGPGRAHIDDIVEPEGEEIIPQPAPQEGWTVIAEEDVFQPHPHLASEIVVLLSVIADNSLFDVLSVLVADCFYSAAHQAIFDAMVALQSRGVVISQGTIESQLSATGKSDSLPALTRLFPLAPMLAVDRATFYRYIGIVKYQCLTRGLRWLLQTILDSSHQGCSPVDLISRLQQGIVELNGVCAYLNRNAAIERKESGYDNNVETAAASRCTLGNFDS
jgi:replicative DNA helicase